MSTGAERCPSGSLARKERLECEGRAWGQQDGARQAALQARGTGLGGGVGTRHPPLFAKAAAGRR